MSLNAEDGTRTPINPKNQDTNNHYDFSRKHLNFEINSQGEIVPLCSNPVPLHERLQKRLDALGFKPYMDKNTPWASPITVRTALLALLSVVIMMC